MAFAISEFWKPRLAEIERTARSLTLPGWSVEPQPNPYFVEADLQLRTGFDDVSAPIWFVAAPGAVGKSTLAKQISAHTGAVYLDLAKADTVAGNYLTGGLVKNGLLDSWQKSKITVLVDALDEARLRVTGQSFDDFLTDVAALARGRSLPVVILGRVGIVEEAWLTLADNEINCPIFDIQLFDPPQARAFVGAALRGIAGRTGNEELLAALNTHSSVYEDAAANFVTGLGETAASDGARFAGYAPVLEAVAAVLATVTNPARLNETVRETMRGEVLQHLTERILAREATKLQEQLPSSIPISARADLYTPDEQLTRLSVRVYGVPAPFPATALPPQQIAAYENAVGAFIAQHPFLDGTGRQASGAVFAAALNAHALFQPSRDLATAAQSCASRGPHTPNPFLINFYLAVGRRKLGEGFAVPPEHVVALYESVRAGMSAGEIAHLTVEGDEDDDSADVEIETTDPENTKRNRRFLLLTSQAGVLQFGRQVNTVVLDAPQLDVTIGAGSPVEIVAPVSMNVARLRFDCPELVVLRADHFDDPNIATVMLEGQNLASSSLTTVPLIRRGVELSVSWPGAEAYPWTNFATDSLATDHNGIHDALNSLRRLVLSFRSHSKGQLARFRGKIEHARMSKGWGAAIRQRLVDDRVLSLEGEMYFLDPQALGRIVGAAYSDLKLKRFSNDVRQYVSSIVRG